MPNESGTVGEAVGRSVIRLVATLRDKDMLTEEEIEDILEPIYEQTAHIDEDDL